MREHVLFLWPRNYRKLIENEKLFEVARGPGFQVGDVVKFVERLPVHNTLTGRSCRKVIQSKQIGGAFGIEDGWSVLGFNEETEEVVN